ncbi:hypothetical protein WJR50_16545 [Catalinimonas sp. 4WD22]|uniref:hypothetical protein n=1 Tax=Catalinimonas locisalis TaxID=3133978 RepID=UPI0031015789
MSLIKQPPRAFILGGVFFILPLLVFIVLATKAIHLLLPLGSKMVDSLGLHSVFGAATVSIFCIFILLLLCYLSGFLIEKGFIKQWSITVEEKLFLFFPSFQMLKYRIIGDQPKKLEQQWEAVLLKDNQFYRLAFITDKNVPGFLSLFLPDAPKMDAGEIRYVRQEECEYYPIPMQEAMYALNRFGRGLPLKNFLNDKEKGTKIHHE